MIAVLSDTHAEAGHALAGRASEAVADADLVLHAGDFTTGAVLDAFHEGCERLLAVHGNADEPAVTDRLPAARTVEVSGVRVALTHREAGGATGLSLFGRQRGADLVISGHTHVPRVREAGPVTLLNPGSHAEPRGAPASHAELREAEDGLDGTVRARDGSVVETFSVGRGSTGSGGSEGRNTGG